MSLLLLLNQPADAVVDAGADDAARAHWFRQWQLLQSQQLHQSTRNDEAPGALIELIAWIVEAGGASGSSRAASARAVVAHSLFAGEATPEWPTPSVLFGTSFGSHVEAMPTGDAWAPTMRVVPQIEMMPGPARVHTATSGASMALHCEIKTCRPLD